MSPEAWEWVTETTPAVTVLERTAKAGTLYLRWYDPTAKAGTRRGNYRYQPADDAEARDWLDLMAEADAEVDEMEDAGCDVCDRPGCSGCDVGYGMIWDDGD